MKKFITNNITLYTLGIVLVFVVWFLISLSQGPGNLIFPDPLRVFQTMFEMLGNVKTYQRIGWTILRTLEGFGIALIGTLLLGILGGMVKPIQTVLRPTMIVFKSAPTAAFVFLFFVLFGGQHAPIFVVSLLALPILYESIVAGFNNIPKEIEDSLKIDSHNKWDGLFRVKMPIAMPYFMVGLASSFALSLKTEIMAEIITGSTNLGLGTAIHAYRIIDAADLTPIFAIALIAIIIILIVDLAGFFVRKHFDKTK